MENPKEILAKRPLKKKNAVKNVPESVHRATIKSAFIEDKNIVFYKKQTKNVVINLAIISKNIRKNGCFFVYMVSSTLFEHSFGWMIG